jgi:hypothetical protein
MGMTSYITLLSGCSLISMILTGHVQAEATNPKSSQPRQTESREALAVLSIIPAQAEPGKTITLYGNGFSTGTHAFLGGNPVPSKVIGPKQLAFQVPILAPGLYALYLQREDGATSKVYNFTVQPLKPIVSSLSTDHVFSCAPAQERDVTISGHNFQQGALVMFDGAAIRNTYSSSESITFRVPQVQGGLHQVQVKNPEDAASTVVGLFIDSTPQIEGISQGSDNVTSYELIIQGHNFQPNAFLLVEGRRIPLTQGVGPIDRDVATYIDCTRIIYNRAPYDPTIKNFQVQVINPPNETSNAVTVTAP